MLQVNNQVKVIAAAGEVIGLVEELRPIAEMPDLPGLSAAGVREVLAEWGVTRVAVIRYQPSPAAQFLLTVLEIGGRWFDLDQREVTLEIVGYYPNVSSKVH